MWITIDQIRYHVEIKGKGKPLICLHGFSENLSTWESIDIAGYQMIQVDLIGHGKSDKPVSKQPYRWKVMIRHLHELIQHLGHRKYVLLGYSMGGRIALAYALTYPAEIETLILESASFGECGMIKRFRRRRNDSKLAENIRHQGIEWFNSYWSKQDIFATQAHLPQAVIDQISLRRLGNTPHALSNTLLGSGQGKIPCLKHKISRLSMPVLCINGEYDKKYKQASLEFTLLNSNIEHEIILGAGHNTHIERPDYFKNVIKKFLDKN